MNDTIELLINHMSIRKFEDREVPRDIVDTIVQCAQMAPTSNHFQAYSIIEITDADKKEALTRISGNQACVAGAKLLLMFCADLHRGAAFYEDVDPALFSSTENFIIGTVDAALAAQKALIAAQSLGLGGVIVGGIRNDVEEVSQLLQLPQLVYPVFLLCLGYPAENPGTKPRLPQAAVHKFNIYDTAQDEALIDQYNRTVSAYYHQRTGGKSDDTWSFRCAKSVKGSPRPKVAEDVKKAGFFH